MEDDKTKGKITLDWQKDPIGNLISQAKGGCEEVTCHPKSEEAQRIDPKYSNLIDCGLLLQIDGKCLKAFIENNGFGFHKQNDEFFFRIDDLKDIAGQYELIKI